MAFRSVNDRVLLVDTESTYGTAATMTAADAILAMNASIQTIGEQLERNIDKPYFGGNPFVLIGKRVELSFEVDLIGHATPGTAAPLAKVLKMCGFGETLDPGVSAIYAPVSSSFESCTIDFFWAGVKFRLLGARGALDIEQNIKNYGKGKVKVIGLLSTPEDGSGPGGYDWSAFQTPPTIEAATWEVTCGAYTAHCVGFMLNANAELPLIETSESRQVVPVARKPAGEITVILNDNLSTWNPWSIAEAHTIVTVTSTVTGGAGKNTAITARTQFGMPEPTEVEGVAALRIPLVAIPSSAGNDEIEIEYT